MRYAKWAILLYLLLKPYYIFNSGSMQFADILVLVAFFIFFIFSRLNTKIRKKTKLLIKQNKDFVIFVLLASIVNFAYFIFLGQFKFILSSSYLLFNLLAIIIFGYFLKDSGFTGSLLKIFKINLVIQLMLFLLGLGRDYNASRYMGTFNDPNQFGFYIFISFLFIYVISVLRGETKKSFYFLPIVLFLVAVSGSTGILLGTSIFLLLQLFYYIYGVKNNYIKFRSTVLISLFVLLATSLLTFFVPTRNISSFIRNYTYIITDSPLVSRVNEKVDRASDNSEVSIIEERGYDKIIFYPEKIIYGAGEGAYNRFDLARFNNELHATFPSILFYYGAIPLFFAVRWVYYKFITASIEMKIAYIALLAESFTLLNQRQSLFWLIFMLAPLATVKKTQKIGSA